MKHYKRNQEVFSGINITPFTDVILVLLIVFMISAPGIINNSLDIRLPKAGTSKGSEKSQVRIALDSRNIIYLNEQVVEKADLKKRMTAIITETGEPAVTLNADTSSAHGAVIEVLDIIRESGAKNIMVGTLKK